MLISFASLLLAFGPPVVLSHFKSITFSAVQQCGNFSVNFSGGQVPSSLPLTLTVVPFNSTPIFIEIPISSWNTTTLTGASVTFLPFPADIEFVASLDDANGVGTGPVSDVIRVDPSDNSSCIPQVSSTPASRYTVDTPFAQCAPVDVRYDTNIVDTPPTIRAFVPRNASFFLNQTDVSNTAGQASFTMDALQGQQVVLLLSDDAGFKGTTDLLAVGGNSSSPTSCLPTPMSRQNNHHGHSSTPTPTPTPSKGSLSKAAVIAIGLASGCIVGGIMLAMAIWLYKERRRAGQNSLKALENSASDDDPARDAKWKNSFRSTEAPPMTAEKPSLPRLVLPNRLSGTVRMPSDGNSLHFVKDPPYTNAKLGLLSPLSSRFTVQPHLGIDGTSREPLFSIPVPLTTPLPSARERARRLTQMTLSARSGVMRSRPSSLSSDDIEHILEMATMYSGPTTPVSPVTFRYPLANSPATRLGEGGATMYSLSNRIGHPIREGPAGAPVLHSPTPGLLSPHTATYRDPPQAPLPSSPLASPVAPFFRPSMLLSNLRESISQARGLSGNPSKTGRAAQSSSFLAM